MGECVEKLPHECGTKDGLQVFVNENGDYNGFCYSCKKYIPNPYEDKPKDYKPTFKKKTEEEIREELEEISTYPTVPLPPRKLKSFALEYFGIKIGLSERDGQTPTHHYYPYMKDGVLVAYKARLIENKAMWALGSMKDVDLFGWEQAIVTGAKTLFITEGELDAVALYQVIKDNGKGTKWEDYNPAIVSLPNGAGCAVKAIQKQIDEIKKYFKDIVLVFDNDDAGKKAIGEVVLKWPEVKVANCPGKDVNDALIKGHLKGIVNAVLFKAEVPKNTRLVNISTLAAKAREPAKWGYSWPWDKITDLTRGIRFGETIYIGAGVKMGKSELVNALAAHFVMEHGWKVFMAKPEEALVKSTKMIYGKAVGKIFHDPKIEFDYEAYDKAEKIIGDKIELLDLYQHMGWKTLEGDIRSAAHAGCKAIIIDPITNLTNGMASAEANVLLQEIAQELSSMAKDLDIVIFIFCHLKAPEFGPPHEMGGKVLSTQFAGSRAMMRSCNYMLGMEGNKDEELDAELRNMRKLIILEDREYGNVGAVNLYWDRNTGLFNEVKDAK